MTASNIQFSEFSYPRGTPVLENICISWKSNEMIALMGPSGCGKTTLLKIIAGVLFNGSSAPLTNGIGYIPQDRQFMPWLSVGRNISFPRSSLKSDISQLCEKFRIREILDRRPHRVSGGQLARAATVRGLVRARSLLLMDEPLSSVDPAIRHDLWLAIKQELHERDVPCIFVTHDIREALAYATRAVVLGPKGGSRGAATVALDLKIEGASVSENELREAYRLGSS